MDWSGGGTWKQWLRRCLALSCMVAAYACIRREEVGILVALPLGTLAAVLALPELVRPFTWWIDAWLGTAPQPGVRPPLDLRLARYYLKEERWEDAYAEYERVLGYHPWAEECYEALFKLGARLGKPEQEVGRLYRKAVRRIRDGEARERLLRARDEALQMIRSGA